MQKLRKWECKTRHNWCSSKEVWASKCISFINQL